MEGNDGTKRPQGPDSTDNDWRGAAESAGQEAGAQAARDGQLDPAKVAEAGKSKGAEAAAAAGGDAASGGEIGKSNAIDRWSSDIKTTPQRQSNYALEHKFGDNDKE